MQQRFTASDFSDAQYNVLNIGDKTILKQWPELKRFPEFMVNLAKKYRLLTDKVHKYALLLYTPNILHRAIPEIAKRKAEAALLAGFSYREGSTIFPQKVEDMLTCEYVEINDLFIRTARLSRNSQFEQLVVYEEARARQMRKLLSDMDGNETTKTVHDNIRRLSEDIERLQNEILFQDNERPLLERLYFAIENIQLGIRPEEIAEIRASGNFDKIVNIKDIQFLEERVNTRDESD